MPAHTTEGGVVKITVVRDVCQNSFTVALDIVFSEPNKLHVIILQPLYITLVERTTVDYKFVIFDFTSSLSTLPIFDECPLYGGLPSATMIGMSFLMRLASLASFDSH